MSGRVAIVAGAGGPLGHAVTAALVAGGLTVVAVDRKEQEMSDLPDGVRREVFTTTTTFAIMQSLRLDLGPSGPVHP